MSESLPQIEVKILPEPGSRFGRAAFDSHIGKRVPVAGNHCTLAAVTVAPDGMSALLHVEPDGRLPVDLVAATLACYSITFSEREGFQSFAIAAEEVTEP